MQELNHLLQNGNAWLFLPTAILLGALHGLEPGHSKTMMAAFIVAVRGTVGQAVLLGLAATLSHTAVVWAIAMTGMYFGARGDVEASEPWFQVASGVMILLIGAWMLWRTGRQEAACFHAHGEHDHGHDHGEHHGHDHDHDHDHGQVHDHPHVAAAIALDEPQDAHARAHAQAIQRRFADRHVTTGQVLLFGLTGGLIPCPASVTVLLLCLQLKRVALGATLVLGFSIGLALTLVAAGVVAALSVQHMARRWSGFDTFARRAPFASGLIIMAVGLYVCWHGALGLGGVPPG